MRRTCLLLLVACLLGCHPKPGSVRNNGKAGDVAHSKVGNDSLDPMENQVGKEVCLGPVVAKGLLMHSKGDLGNVGRFLIPVHFLEGGASKAGWKPEYEALVGKMVEVKGIHYQYRCGPIEQCLEGGIMDWLREIEYLRAAE